MDDQHPINLDPIIEDDLPRSTVANPTSELNPSHDDYHLLLSKHTDDLVGVLQVRGPGGNKRRHLDQTLDSAGEEEFDMNVSSSNDSDGGELNNSLKYDPLDLKDGDESEPDDIRPGHWQQPRSAPAPAATKPKGKLPTGKRPVPEPSATSGYDRDTCCKSVIVAKFLYLTGLSCSFRYSMCDSSSRWIQFAL